MQIITCFKFNYIFASQKKKKKKKVQLHILSINGPSGNKAWVD